MGRLGRIAGEAYDLYWKDFRRDQRIMLAVVALCVVAVGLVLVQGALPFEPLKIHGYRTEPGVVCPGESVTTYVDSEVEEPFLGSVGRRGMPDAEVATQWRATDGRLTPTVDEPINLDPYPRQEVRSPVSRTAPRDPGEWSVRSEVTVRGTVLGLGRTDAVRAASEPALTVLPASNERCE